MEGYYVVGLASLTFDIKVANFYYLTLLINQIRQRNVASIQTSKTWFFDQPMAVKEENSIDQYLQTHVFTSTVVFWLKPGTPESECIKKKLI